MLFLYIMDLFLVIIFLNILVLLVDRVFNVDHPMVALFRLMCNWKIDGCSLVNMVGVTTFHPFLFTFLLVGFIEISVLHWYKNSCILKLIFVKSLALLHVVYVLGICLSSTKALWVFEITCFINFFNLNL